MHELTGNASATRSITASSRGAISIDALAISSASAADSPSRGAALTGMAFMVVRPMRAQAAATVSTATRARPARAGWASSTVSEIGSAALSGWPSETDSEVNTKLLFMR